MWNELKKIKSADKDLREFGLTIGAILIILGGIALWRGKATYPYFLVAGLMFGVFGLVAPRVLKPVQKAWMGFSIILGFFMSRIILMILFYAVITPIGLIIRSMGKDILDQRIDKVKASYWIERTPGPKSKESYENQY